MPFRNSSDQTMMFGSVSRSRKLGGLPDGLDGPLAGSGSAAASSAVSSAAVAAPVSASAELPGVRKMCGTT